MQQFYIFRATRVFLIAIAIFSSAVACRQEKQPPQADSPVAPSAVKSAASPLPSQPPLNSNQPTAFELALDKAAGGHSISQSARSAHDWQLVARQYQDAIALLRLVERDSPYYSISQSKITEYQRLSLNAQKSAQNPAPIPSPVTEIATQPVVTPSPVSPSALSGRIINVTEPTPSVSEAIAPVRTIPVKPTKVVIPAKSPIRAVNPSPYTQVPKFYTQQTQVFTVPIKRRAGGTPVIEVTFNGTQKFEMIVDTGASGTVITQNMANALRIIPTSTSKANTASAKGVEFPIGYVNSMEASGVRVGRVPVAIANSELDTGLLGHDFFQDYDITIRRNVVEFRPHREDSPINSPKTPPSVQVYPKPRRSPISP